MSNRAELARRLVAYRAAVKVIEDALKVEGEIEHRENETVSTHRLAIGRMTGSQTQDHLVVDDPKVFLAWLAGAHPTEVETKTVQVVRNQEWLRQAQEIWARISREEYDLTPPEERGDRPIAMAVGGAVIPGAHFEPGGRYITTSFTPNMQARKRAIEAAKRGVHEGDWSGLEAAVKDPTYLIRTERPEEEDVVVTLAGIPVETVEGL